MTQVSFRTIGVLEWGTAAVVNPPYNATLPPRDKIAGKNRGDGLKVSDTISVHPEFIPAETFHMNKEDDGSSGSTVHAPLD